MVVLGTSETQVFDDDWAVATDDGGAAALTPFGVVPVPVP